MRLGPLLSVPLVLALLVTGCCDAHESARCGTPAAEPIASLTIVTVTGSDSTDASIYFCIEHASTLVPECFDLDTPVDDFEQHQTDAFTVTPATPIVAGDFRAFYLQNRGGGFLGNNDWDMVSLRVEATGTSSARWDLYNEPAISCGDEQIGSGATWRPASCTL